MAAILTMMLMAAFSASAKDAEMRLEAHLSSTHPYEGQPVALTVTLISDTPDIAYAQLNGKEEIRGANVLNAPMLETRDDRLHRITEDGRRRYSAVVYRAMLMPNEGTIVIPRLSFTIGEQVAAVVNHPFFGPIRSTDVEERVLSTREIKQKIYKLPKAVAGYSGAIGNFKVNAILPPGKIEQGQDGVLIIRIEGEGYVDTDAVPGIRGIFPQGLELKAETSDSDVRIEGDRMMTVIETEYTFSATEAGDYTLPAVEFIYFDPDSRSYITARSKSLKINVQESKIPSAPPVLHSI